MRLPFIPREEKFFELFVEDAQNVLAGARLLEEFFRSYDQRERIASQLRDLEHRGTTVLMSGVRPEHRVLLGDLAFGEGRHLFARTPDAIAHARALVTGPDEGQPDSDWTNVSWR